MPALQGLYAIIMGLLTVQVKLFHSLLISIHLDLDLDFFFVHIFVLQGTV